MIKSVLVLGLVFTIMADEYRSFTDKEGREIMAKIIKIDSRSDKVTIQRDDRRRVTVPANIFSVPDQTYISEWVAAQAFMSSSKLKVSVDKKRVRPIGMNRRLKKKKNPVISKLSWTIDPEAISRDCESSTVPI